MKNSREVEELKEIIKDMVLPKNLFLSGDEVRDVRWLARNIGFVNAGHPQYQNAVEAIAKCLNKQNAEIKAKRNEAKT